MKTLKKMICLTVSALLLSALCACGAEKPVPSEPDEAEIDESYQDLWQEEEKTEDFRQEELWEAENAFPMADQPETKNAKYESEVLGPYASTAQIKDIFHSFADDGQKMFWTKDGQLLHCENLQSEFWFGDRSDIEAVLSVWNEPAYVDGKGFLYIRANNRVYPCKDIKGQIVWYFVDMLSGNLCICSQDSEGYLYYNSIDPTGIKEKYDNEKLFIYDFRTKTGYDRVDAIRFVVDDGIQPNVYVELDGKAYYSNVTGVDFFGGPPKIQIDSAYATEIENVLAYGYGGAQSVLYKASGDQSAVYYRYGFNGTELPIFMPKGKTVDQLTQVVFGDVTYLLFDDGSVYSGKLVHTIVGPDMALDETLTDLNRNNAICRIYQSANIPKRPCALRLLMDDNVTYVYNGDNG